MTRRMLFTPRVRAGTPKGVVVEDGALANYLQWALDYYSDGPIDFAFHSSPAVDLTITSIYLPLITGGRVEIFSEDGETGEIPIASVFEADNVDAIKLTPALPQYRSIAAREGAAHSDLDTRR